MKYGLHNCPVDLEVRVLKRDRLLLIAACLILLGMLVHVGCMHTRLMQDYQYQVMSGGDGDGL
jgi:hypothetical protein